MEGEGDNAEKAWREATELLAGARVPTLAHRHTLAKLYMVSGNLYMFRGANGLAETAFDKALATAEKLVLESPEDRAYRFTLAEILSNRGYLAHRSCGGRGGPCIVPRFSRASRKGPPASSKAASRSVSRGA